MIVQIKCRTSLSRRTKQLFILVFSSRRVQVDGSVDEHPVKYHSGFCYRCVCCIAWWVEVTPLLILLQMCLLCRLVGSSHTPPYEPVPCAAVSLRSAHGLPPDVLGLVEPLTRGRRTCTFTALVVPSLGLDSLHLDNQVKAEFGSV